MYAIKQLRRKKNMSQSDLAKEIGVSLRTIQLYEKRDANIPIKNLSRIAAYFDLSIAELYLQEVNESQASYSKRKPFTKRGSVFYPLDHGKFSVMLPLVLMEYQKDYIEFLTSDIKEEKIFQTGFIIDFIPEETLRAFEVKGDSMNDKSIEGIPNKAFVLGMELQKNMLSNAHSTIWNKAYMLVCKDRIICKWLTGFNPEKNTVYCQNLNKSPEYQDFELALDDILKTFVIIKKQF
ncbi:helix-turn-helix transcriptional regulator [Muricauda aurantiaca]|nr:helix-turn-helix transcriptional regulator [Allomuricauda aurantiaca]